MKCAYDENRYCDSECTAYAVKTVRGSYPTPNYADMVHCGRGDFKFKLNEHNQQRDDQPTDESK